MFTRRAGRVIANIAWRDANNEIMEYAVSDNLKFFSAEWCVVAKDVANASETMRAGFKDADSFTNNMELGCLDRGLATHIEWKGGRIVSWGPELFDPSELEVVIRADLATWKAAAEGVQDGGTLLMGGHLQFAKGPMSAAIENGEAFNAFLRSWGEVPTDWDR